MSDPLAGKNLQELLNEATGQKTFINMTKLANQDEYECPTHSGIKYKRRMLKPRDIVALNKLQLALNDLDQDPEARMKNIRDQAEICLDGITDEKWEETDASLMEIIIGACILISKGFRDA